MNIFITCFDKDAIDISLLNNIEKIKKQNPSYNVVIYDNKSFDEYYKKKNKYDYENYYCKLNKNIGAMISDYMRYVLLYYEGGIYIDIKSNFKIPINNFIDNQNIFFKWETKAMKEILNWCLIIPNAYSNIMKDMIDNIHNNINNYDFNKINIKNTRINVLEFTGPRLLTKVCNKHNIIGIDWHQYLTRVSIKNYKKKYSIPHYSQVHEHLIIS